MALADYMPKRHQTAGDPITEPEPPRVPEWSRVAPRRQLSEQAAAAAQHVFDLETEIDHLKNDRDQWRNRAERAEAACQNLHDDLTQVKAERDTYQAHAIEILTKLQVSGKIILEAMQSPMSKRMQGRPVEVAADKALAEV